MPNGVRGKKWQPIVPSNTGQDDATVKGRSDQLLLTVALVQQDEDVHGADLRDRVIGSVQPQALLAVVTFGYFLEKNRIRVLIIPKLALLKLVSLLGHTSRSLIRVHQQ